MPTRVLDRGVAALVAIEGFGMAALVVWQILALLGGDTGVISTALALVVLTALGTAAVLAFAVAIWRDQSWGRSGAIVTQLLILAVALGAATGQYAHPLIALAIALPAFIILVLLVMAVREAAARLRAESAERSDAE